MYDNSIPRQARLDNNQHVFYYVYHVYYYYYFYDSPFPLQMCFILGREYLVKLFAIFKL